MASGTNGLSTATRTLIEESGVNRLMWYWWFGPIFGPIVDYAIELGTFSDRQAVATGSALRFCPVIMARSIGFAVASRKIFGTWKRKLWSSPHAMARIGQGRRPGPSHRSRL